MNKKRQSEILKSLYDLQILLISMTDDEVEIFKQNNRHLIHQLIQNLDSM